MCSFSNCCYCLSRLSGCKFFFCIVRLMFPPPQPCTFLLQLPSQKPTKPHVSTEPQDISTISVKNSLQIFSLKLCFKIKPLVVCQSNFGFSWYTTHSSTLSPPCLPLMPQLRPSQLTPRPSQLTPRPSQLTPWPS